ncbi:flagellar export protein FliJ [Tumebacillus sp. BK434]|uniref:flagellar export protein FliJ n=1 Tax=Tumebacillus sp. BK434 TaxID=2512169 RepID=UPI00105124BC|nr:flagellar FliJ family protein [Tumebacillus sp. BK434]TCP58821.1 flagellar export protein FliJ [Tumebacillus sp. BK434]
MTISLTSLQKITTLKNRITQQATWEYAESKRKLDAEYDKLYTLAEQHDAAKVEMHQATSERISSQHLHAWTLYLSAQQLQMLQQAQAIAEQKVDCEDKQDRLKGRFLDEQMWSKLQEKRRVEVQVQLDRQAQEALDEAAAVLRSRAGR